MDVSKVFVAHFIFDSDYGLKRSNTDEIKIRAEVSYLGNFNFFK